jgi:hypothetical protein
MSKLPVLRNIYDLGRIAEDVTLVEKIPSGTMIPKYCIPLRVMCYAGEALHIFSTDGTYITEEEGAGICKAIGNLELLCKWMSESEMAWLAFYFFTKSVGVEVTSPMLVPCLRSHIKSPETFVALNSWNMPPMKMYQYRQLYIKSGTVPYGYSHSLYDDSLLGSYYTKGLIIPSNGSFPWLSVSSPVTSLKTLNSITFVGNSFIPRRVDVSKAVEVPVCPHGGSNCRLCRIIPGTVIFRWENCLASPVPSFNTSTDNAVAGLPEKWSLFPRSLGILESYFNHGWRIIIGTNHINLYHRKFSAENYILDQIPEHIDCTISATNPGFRRYTDKMDELVDEHLSSPSGRNLICYDSNPNVLVGASSQAASHGIFITTVLMSVNELRMMNHEIPNVTLHNGVVVSKTLVK